MKKIGKELFKGREFVLTLCLCLLLVGGVGVYSYSKYSAELKDELSSKSEELQDALANATKDDEQKPAVTTAPKITEAKVTDGTDATEKTGKNNAEEVAKNDDKTAKTLDVVVRPINGEVTTEFSNGELVKSPTLNVWKTHDGVDIAAKENEKVKSMTSGTVTDVYEDAMWGNCVVIDHLNGIEGHYYNLSADVPVAKGQEVSAGTVIGSVGNTAQCEIKEATHLHFGVKQNGVWIDPVALISGEGS